MSDIDWQQHKRLHRSRFQESVSSLDRYGIPSEEIVEILEALSDFVDDEAHGRKQEYKKSFDTINSSLNRLQERYL